MRKLGKKQLTVNLSAPLRELPPSINSGTTLSSDGLHLTYTFDSNASHSGIPDFLKKLTAQGIEFHDLQSKESSLEEIFVSLVGKA
ncbi:MAG TPA: multidrug ABC transporter ATP-binding protein, partial [Bdellovibrionota bacterium]